MKMASFYNYSPIIVLSVVNIVKVYSLSVSDICPISRINNKNSTCLSCDEYCNRTKLDLENYITERKISFVDGLEAIRPIDDIGLPPHCFNTSCKTIIDTVVLYKSYCLEGFIYDIQLGVCEHCSQICPSYNRMGLQYLCDTICGDEPVIPTSPQEKTCPYGYYRELYKHGASICRSCQELCTVVKDENLILKTYECHTIGNCTKWLEQIMYKKVSRHKCDKDKIYDMITEECRLCENVCGMYIQIGMKTICDETCQITSLIGHIKLSSTSKPTSNSSISSDLTKILLISLLVSVSVLILILIIICCVKRFCYCRLKCFNRRKFYEFSDRNTSSINVYHFSNEARHVLPNDKTSDKSNTKDRSERKQQAPKQQATDSENHSLICQDAQGNDQMHVEKCIRDIDHHDRSNKDVQSEQNDVQVTLGFQAKTQDSRSACNLMQSNEDNTPVQVLSYNKIEDSNFTKAQKIDVPVCYVSETPVEMDLFRGEDYGLDYLYHYTRIDDNRNRNSTDRVQAAEISISCPTRDVRANLDDVIVKLQLLPWFKFIDFKDGKLVIVYEGLSDRLAIDKVSRETCLPTELFLVQHISQLDSLDNMGYASLTCSMGGSSLNTYGNIESSTSHSIVSSKTPSSVYSFKETVNTESELNQMSDVNFEGLKTKSWFKYVDFENGKYVVVYDEISSSEAITKIRQETGLPAYTFNVKKITLLNSTDNSHSVARSLRYTSGYANSNAMNMHQESFANTSVQSSVPSVYNFVETIYNHEELDKVTQYENKDGPHIKGPDEHGHHTAGEIEQLPTDMSDIPDIQSRLQALAAEQWVKRLISNGRFVRVWYDAIDSINAQRLVGAKLGVDSKHFSIEYAHGQRH